MKLFRCLAILVLAIMLSSCASTSLDNNLDTKIEGKGNSVVFSWTDQHPFAQNYKTARMQLIAEYQELDMNGNTRPVKQVVANMSRDFPELNSKVFGLPRKLRSIPESSNVCLYIAMNNQAIPVRASTGGNESSRFAFPLWQQNVFEQTKGDFFNQIKNKAESNLRSARDSEYKAKNSPFHELNNLNNVLQRENLAGISKVSSMEDCDKLYIEPKFVAKTPDILPAEDIQTAAASICTDASFYFFDNYINRAVAAKTKEQIDELIPWFYNRIDLALILPMIYRNQTQLKQNGFFETANFTAIKDYYEQFVQSAEQAQKYMQKSNAYKPDGINIWSSQYAVEAGKVSIFTNLMGLSDKAFTPAQIKEVVINEWTEISYCTFDMVKHLNTKRRSYQLNLENAPKRAIASTKYFRNYCATTFDNHEATVEKYTQQREEAEKKLDELNKQMAPTGSKTQYSSEEVLNQKACKI
ncbi:MAG: hypothetical protein ACI9O6_000444 [Glaciecola sp.]|jgi:hypothetical protein